MYAAFPEPALASDFRAPTESIQRVAPEDVLIYHASYGLREITNVLLRCRGKIVLCYHNITPPKYFEAIDPQFADGLEYGRTELDLVRDRVVAAIGVSEYNARELRERGYLNVLVGPLGLQVDRLESVVPSMRYSWEIQQRFQHGYVVAISQFLPHKKLEDVVSSVFLSRKFFGTRLGLCLVGTGRSPAYAQALGVFSRQLLGDNYFGAGRVTDSELHSILQNAVAYVGMSEHEGLSLPLIEAMSIGTPALVRNAGAVAETAGDGALVLDSHSTPSDMAEAISRLLIEDRLRLKLQNAGRARARQIAESANTINLLSQTGLIHT